MDVFSGPAWNGVLGWLDPAFIALALGNIARAREMSQLARNTGLAREGLYKAPLAGEPGVRR